MLLKSKETTKGSHSFYKVLTWYRQLPLKRKKIHWFFIHKTFYILYLVIVDRKNKTEEINLSLQKEKSFVGFLF